MCNGSNGKKDCQHFSWKGRVSGRGCCGQRRSFWPFQCLHEYRPQLKQRASICEQHFRDFSSVGCRYVAQPNRFRLIASLFCLDMSELCDVHCKLDGEPRQFARHRQWCPWDCGCSTTQQSTFADVCGCASTSKGTQRWGKSEIKTQGLSCGEPATTRVKICPESRWDDDRIGHKITRLHPE